MINWQLFGCKYKSNQSVAQIYFCVICKIHGSLAFCKKGIVMPVKRGLLLMEIDHFAWLEYKDKDQCSM